MKVSETKDILIPYIYVQSTSCHSSHGGPRWQPPGNTTAQACSLSVTGIRIFFHKVLYFDLFFILSKTNLKNHLIELSFIMIVERV